MKEESKIRETIDAQLIRDGHARVTTAACKKPADWRAIVGMRGVGIPPVDSYATIDATKIDPDMLLQAYIDGQHLSRRGAGKGPLVDLFQRAGSAESTSAWRVDWVRQDGSIYKRRAYFDENTRNGCVKQWTDAAGAHGTIVVTPLHAAAPVTEELQSLQDRVQPWMMACFGEMISGDREERNHRFFEEATELVQACGMTASEAHQLVDYVYGRPVGEAPQEVGGVMVTLAALCLANDLDMHQCAETELARIWTKVDQIRAKHAAKPKRSPLPIAAPEVERRECVHDSRSAFYDHIQCNDCGAVFTDTEWGIASRQWFKSLDVAKFYRKHGPLPDQVRSGTATGIGNQEATP